MTGLADMNLIWNIQINLWCNALRLLHPTVKIICGAMPFGYHTLREYIRFVGCNNQRALHHIYPISQNRRVQ